MKRGRKTNLFKKIDKLRKGTKDDRDISIELLLSKAAEMHPDEWSELNKVYYWSDRTYLHVEDLQKYLYDKRQSEQELLRKDKKATTE